MNLHVLTARLVWSAVFFGGCYAWAQEAPRPASNAPVTAVSDGVTPATREAMKRIEELLADAETVSRLQKGDADELLRTLKGVQGGSSPLKLRKEAYQELLKSRSESASFAPKARILAALARLNKARESEIVEAERLDHRLNPGCADAWMRRAIQFAKEKNQEWAQDYFFEGLRRLDFSDVPEAVQSMDMHEWCRNVFQSGHAHELIDSLCQALALTEKHQAGSCAGRLVDSVLNAPGAPENLGRLTRLLECVRTHQPHLPRASEFSFPYHVKTLEEKGASAAATEVARAFLLSWWPEEPAAEEVQQRRRRTEEWKEQQEAPWTWGYRLLSEQRGAVPGVFVAALREPRGSFLDDLERLAREHPDDEQAVTAALVARAMVGRLPAASLATLEDCYPLARMRVGWKLCEYAPVENLPKAEVAKLLVGGAEVLLQHNADVPGRLPGSLPCVERVMQQLESLGAKEELTQLARQFVARISGGSVGKNRVLLERWTDFEQMVVRYVGEEEKRYMVESFKEGLRRSMRDYARPGEWNEYLIHLVTTGYEKLPPDLAPPVATLVYDAWLDDAKMLESDQLTPAARKQTPFVALRVLRLLLMSGTLDEHKVNVLVNQMETAAALPDMASMEWLTEPLRYAKGLLEAGGEALPMALLRIELPSERNQTAKVAWQMDTRSPERIENERRLLEMDYGDRMEGTLDVDLLPYLDGKYDLEIYAGAREDLMRPVALLKGVKSIGMADMRGLPVSGWMRAVVKEPRTGVARFGPPVLYSTAPAVLDSRVKNGDEVVQSVELEHAYGIAISKAVPVMPGAEYLVTAGDAVRPRKGGRIQENDVSLVGLNAQMEPVGILHASAFAEQPDPLLGNRWIVRTDDWTTLDGWSGVRQLGTRAAQDVVYVALTGVLKPSPHIGTTPVVVQPFGALAKSPVDPAALPMLKPELLTPLGFAVGSWHVAPMVSRAVFSAKGSLSVHDTSTVPWETLSMQRSNSLLGSELVYALSDQEALCFELPGESRAGSGFRRIRWNDDLEYEQRARTELPFAIERGELHPSGKGVLLLGQLSDARSDFQVAWVNHAGEVSTITLAHAGSAGGKCGVARWLGDDSVVVQDNGTLHHLTWKNGTLKLERSEPGTTEPNALPEGARAGHGLEACSWRLEAPRLLVRQEPMTRSVQARYLLSKSCKGIPIGLGGREDAVILQTMSNDMVRVVPPKAEIKKETNVPTEPMR